MSFSPEEQKIFLAIFKSLDKENLGIVTGEASRSTFEKSGLPPHVLGEIWQLSDPTNLGFLNEYSFFVALRLIGHVQAGKTPDQSLINVSGPLPKLGGDNGSNAGTQRQSSISSIPQQSLQPQFTSLPPLTNADISKFSQLFAKSATNGNINGQQARSIFTKAKLSTAILSQIWSLVDLNNKGSLNRDEFIVSMFLIQGLISGNIKSLPAVVPSQIWSQLKSSAPSAAPLQQQPSFNSSLRSIPQNNTGGSRSASSDWVISPEKRQQFDSIFEGLDKSSTGTLSPGEVAAFLTTSKLSQHILANIWDLSDIHNNGVFGKEEFAIAMFLVQKKMAGVELPDVIPESLIEQQPVVSQKQHQPPPQPVAPVVKKSTYNDLLDLNDAFSTPSTSATGSDAPKPTGSSNSPFASAVPTGSFQPRAFVPTSSFGQTLAKQNTADNAVAKSPVVPQNHAPNPKPVPVALPFSAPIPVPLPVPVPVPVPVSRQTAVSHPSSNPSLSRLNNSSDLLTDSNPEVSGKLSEATTDLANLSNQIGSLTTQTSALHEKRTRAERELAKMTALKADIEGKLNNLRNSYALEVQQTENVEKLLAESTSETESLREELSVAEARSNEIQDKLQQLQTELEESQKENAALKERLGTLNAEHNDLVLELEHIQTEAKQSKGLTAINSEQLRSSELKSEGVRAEIENLLSSVKELDTHHETLLSKQVELESVMSSLALAESELAAKQQTHLENTTAYEQKQHELEQRLAEQKQYEVSVQQQEEKLHQLWTDLQSRQQQLQKAEEELQTNQIQYAERVQSFSMKQIEDATRGLDIGAGEETIPQTSSKSVTLEEPVKEFDPQDGNSSSLGSGLIGAAVGLVAGSVGATAVAAASAIDSSSVKTSGTTEKSTDFSSSKDSTNATTTEADVETDEANYQENVGQFRQFGHLDIVRPDSTTSSVVNNAPQSVRGDYEEEEDQETIDAATEEDNELPASAQDVLAKDYNKIEEDQKWAKENELLEKDDQDQVQSPGSFEIVDKEEEDEDEQLEKTLTSTSTADNTTADNTTADVAEPLNTEEDNKIVDRIANEIPGAWNAKPIDEQFVRSAPTAIPTIESSEFPPIKELDIDESDSESEEQEEEEEKDKENETSTISDANIAPIPVAIPSKSTQPTFDDEFDDMEPSVPVATTQANCTTAADIDTFDDFEGLTAAAQEDDLEEDFSNGAIASQDIEDSSFYGAVQSQGPELTEQQGIPESKGVADGEGHDEWEQIFAGFGNQPQNGASVPSASQVVPPLLNPQPQLPQASPTSTTSSRPKIATTPKSIAVQELTGMGFTEEEALSALKREKWNLEAATNFLLDNA